LLLENFFPGKPHSRNREAFTKGARGVLNSIVWSSGKKDPEIKTLSRRRVLRVSKLTFGKTGRQNF